jgi:hypothetical protein
VLVFRKAAIFWQIVSNPFCAEVTLRTMVGVMEERGRFEGLTKLAGAGGGELRVVFAGMEKSSISLLSRMPVLGDTIRDPKYELTVLVMETAFRSLSTTDRWLVPCSGRMFHLKHKLMNGKDPRSASADSGLDISVPTHTAALSMEEGTDEVMQEDQNQIYDVI